MQIKPLKQEREKLDVHEWNDETPVYIRPLNGFEQLVFNDLFLVFFSDQKSYEERYNAGFKAAKMALVGEDNAPILTDEDEETIKSASVVPIFRLFNSVFANKSGELETIKKN